MSQDSLIKEDLNQDIVLQQRLEDGIGRPDIVFFFFGCTGLEKIIRVVTKKIGRWGKWKHKYGSRQHHEHVKRLCCVCFALY
jgi:hypothetical protein